MSKRRRPTIIGVDPGKNGAIATIYPSGAVKVIPMPDTERDMFEVFAVVKSTALVCLEAVHAGPGNAAGSTFKFGVNYGSIRMAIISNQLKMVTVSPQKWQRSLGVIVKGRGKGKKGSAAINENKGEKKRLSKARAQELFPNVHLTLKTADALLIAEYARRNLL